MTQTVWHTGYDIVLNLSLPDLGHPDRPGLWEEIYRSQHFERGMLLCTWAERGVRCPEAMYVQVRDGMRVAAHLNRQASPHAPDSESNLHRVLKERVAGTAQRAGYSADIENPAKDRARITDVLVTGENGTRIGWEIQLSGISPGKVVERSNLAHRDGITPLWAVDSPRAAPINRAPWARLDEVDDWRVAARIAMQVQGGVRYLDMRVCEVTWFERCPVSYAPGRRFCGGKHPVLAPKLVLLDELVTWSAAGEYVPLFVPAQTAAGGAFMWVTSQDKAEFLQGRPEPSPYGIASEERALQGTLLAAVERPEDLACHYGEASTVRQVRAPRDSGRVLDVSAWAPSESPSSAAASKVNPALAGADWRRARMGEPAPCTACGRPAVMRHPVTQSPGHKVCFG